MKLFKVAALLLLTAASSQAMAEKVVVLGIQQAVLASEAAKQFDAKLKAEFSDEQALLVDLEKQAKAAKDKFEANRDLASPEQLKQLRSQFQKVFAEYQRRGKELQQKNMQRQQVFLGEMKPKLDIILKELIKTEGYDVILAKSATLYAKPEVDITPKVVELLNQQ
ncbi:OmpH family outer membrane protein [Pontibacterium sp. N1Y112]|uniref:OmpH family outer membrane protein n=1 Tax=Pontibacterium sinense TaxID=2781979 RepID=A0A8J7F9V5_9GAMM|nr:OmpH family outer membrane protein [Pontibacterium sinense]MBE9396052.1 OmpH family outer membrane protein [Pontibacterium sinense]